MAAGFLKYNRQNQYPDKVLVTGGNRIKGKIRIAGSKIASIPIIAATILSKQEITLENVPNLKDVRVLVYLINQLGGQTIWTKNTLKINNNDLRNLPLPAEVVTSVHGTIYLIPTLLARFGKVSIARSSGGCQIGERPIEHILEVLRTLGAIVSMNGDEVIATTTRLKGTSMSAQFSHGWDKFRSGTTKAFLLAGVGATGKSSLTDAYTRSSITELVRFLKVLGAKVTGEGTPNIEIIESVIGGGHFVLAGDYLEALTFVACVAACGGELTIEGFDVSHCEAELRLFQEMGLTLEYKSGRLTVKNECKALKPVAFTTSTIDTDIQSIISAALTTSCGQSNIKEVVWENRYGYVQELRKMGANLRVDGNELTINGVNFLTGASIHAEDLRAAAALLIAAAAAKGQSVVSGLSHLERGYCHLIKKLISINIDIQNK